MINSMSELPKKGYVEKDLKKFGLNDEQMEQMAIYYLDKTKRSAWLLVLSDYKRSSQFFDLKNRLNKNNIKIKQVESLNKSLLDAVYENDAQQNEEQTEDDSIYKDEFYQIITDALQEGVSDVHVEKRKNSGIIRMRKHGDLFDYKELSASHASKLCNVIYTVLAEEKQVMFEERSYQPAAVNLEVEGQDIKLRYQSMPVYPEGFDAVMRVLPIGSDDEEEEDISLSALGYSNQQIKSLLNITSRPVGALIIAGVTGSGKSTTLKNLVMFINPARGYKNKIYTIEDPPEYKIPKVSQIPVLRDKLSDNNQSPFEEPLTAAMRADPDVLVIGEVRDRFTAEGLKKATQSGHQVMTTIHTSSALGIVERLADNGISYSVLGAPEFLMGLCYQKLLAKLCPECSIDFYSEIAGSSASTNLLELAERIDEVLGGREYPIKLRNEKGCEHCNYEGILGRTVCAEIIMPNVRMLNCFKNQDHVGAYLAWRNLSDGNYESDNMQGKTVLEHAISKMIKGIVSPVDLELALGPINNVDSFLEQTKKESQGDGDDETDDLNDLDSEDNWSNLELD